MDWGGGRTPSWAPSGSLSPEEDLLSQASHHTHGVGAQEGPGDRARPTSEPSPPRPALPDQKASRAPGEAVLTEGGENSQLSCPSAKSRGTEKLQGFRWG